MHAVDVDLADDRFDVSFDRGRVSAEQLLEAIRGLAYEPELVAAPTATPLVADHLDLDALPAELQVLFAEARKTDKPVLLEFTGPG